MFDALPLFLTHRVVEFVKAEKISNNMDKLNNKIFK